MNNEKEKSTELFSQKINNNLIKSNQNINKNIIIEQINKKGKENVNHLINNNLCLNILSVSNFINNYLIKLYNLKKKAKIKKKMMMKIKIFRLI